MVKAIDPQMELTAGEAADPDKTPSLLDKAQYWRQRAIGLVTEVTYWRSRAKQSETQRNEASARATDALHQRNILVAFLANLFPGSHLVHGDPSFYPDAKSEDERQIIRDLVCVHLTDGRNATFHFNPDEVDLFRGLEYQPSDWDGHTTADKYALLTILGRLAREHHSGATEPTLH